MSTGEASASADSDGDAVASTPATKKPAKAKAVTKAKGGGSKEGKETKEAKSPKATKPPKVAAKNGSAKAAEVAKAAPAKATQAKPAPAKAKGTPDRAAYRAAADLLKMASDPTRVTVLMILVNGEQNVTELCGHLSQSQPAVSHHLALMRHGGLIFPTRAGKNNIYALTEKGTTLAESIQRVYDAGI
jgi:ArsR family transcriptional regulator, zinc-responsive transcriptional repressor